VISGWAVVHVTNALRFISFVRFHLATPQADVNTIHQSCSKFCNSPNDSFKLACVLFMIALRVRQFWRWQLGQVLHQRANRPGTQHHSRAAQASAWWRDDNVSAATVSISPCLIAVAIAEHSVCEDQPRHAAHCYSRTIGFLYISALFLRQRAV
jgi:hypothetical protein